MALTLNSTKLEALQQLLLQRAAIARSLSKFSVMLLVSSVFVYVNSVMFVALLSKPVFRETPRYILFTHMLCNDSIMIVFTVLISVVSYGHRRPTKATCSLVMILTTSTATNAPLNLGVMSLERYTAICFPLRHSQLATTRRTYVAIVGIWFFGLLNPVADSVYSSIVDPEFFLQRVKCGHERMFRTAPWQTSLSHSVSGLYYVTVTLVILFSYINVVRVARSASSNDKSTGKAHRTLLLHLVQLVLCLNTLLYSHTISFMAAFLSQEVYSDVRYGIYLLAILLPRCLSPLIYGMRDEAVRHLFVQFLKCTLSRVKPIV
ncbi:odorant receptor 131-2-like [Engraulis encrasicolus]|uniref:odorant receptor 131-2-like n=1 Tax=Engraulis encrasicolus TaxID=184585 RepID=UPI002FD0BD98